MTVGTVVGLYFGYNRVDGFAVLASIRAELVITITMAVASRAPLSGKLPTPPKIRDSDGGSQNSSHYF